MFPFGIASRGPFRRQIILTFVVGFFALITAFAVYMVNSERENLYQDSIVETTGLAESLAVSSLAWVLANDVAGLQEVVRSFQNYPELRYAMVISPTGRVLAHSDAAMVGQYVADRHSQALVKAPPQNRVMMDDATMADVAVPINVNGRHVGWARIGLGREHIAGDLARMIWGNVLFVLLSTALSLFAAILIADRLGARIGTLVEVAEEVQAGNFATRARIPGAEDEITKLADNLNQMLDALARNEKELRAASLYTRSLIEASLDPLVTISAEGKITDVNRATEAVIGRSRSELVGTDFSDYFTDPDRARDGYRQVFTRGEVTDYPLAIRHRDGHVTDVLYNASVYRNEAGEVLGVLAAARDITERKRAQATRTQLAAIVESSDDAIIGKTLDNIITSWNRGAEQMYGYTAREAVGQPISLIVPEDKQQELQAFSERIQQGERVRHHETVRVARDGRRLEVSLSLSPILDDRGAITGTSAIARDITERKRDEEMIRKNNQLLETVFSSIHVMIAYLDRDFNFIKVNRAYAASDQRTPDFFPGKNHFDLFPDEENKAIFQKVVATGEAVVYYAKPFEYAEHPERGTTYWDWRLEPVAGADGQIEGLLFSLLNVTEQTLAVQKIRAAAQYARSLIEASLDPLVTISAAGKITDVNTATEQVTGHSRETLIGTDFSGYFTDPDKAREGYQQVFTRGFVTDYPLALCHRNGHVTDVLYNATVYRDEAGAVSGVFAAARDVTERNKAEKEVAQLNMQNRLILDSAGEGIYGQDIDGICTFLNPAALQMLGFNAEELVGRNSHSMFHHSRLDGSPYPQEECPILAQQEQGRIYRGSDLFWRKDGGSFPVDLISTPILDDGKVTGAVVAFNDITERKKAEAILRESEEALKEAQRIAQLGSWHMDLATNQVVWSEVLYKMYGFDPALPPPLYTESMKLFTPESWERLSTSIARTTETGIPYEIELEMVDKEGGRGWMWARGELERDARGAPFRVRGVVMDITARKQAEEKIRESEKKFKAMTDTSPLAIYMSSGLEQKAEYINPTFTRLFGYTMDEVPTAAQWWPLAYPDETYRRQVEEEWQRKVEQAIKTSSEIEPMEVVVTCKDGSRRNILWGYISTGVQNWAFGLDLTERKRAEEELRRSEHGLAEAQRIAHLGNWNLDLVSNVLTWSDEIYRIFEIDPDEFGASYEAFLNAIHPDDRDMVNSAFTESVENKIPYDIVHRLLMKDGRIKYVNEKCETYYAGDGKPLRSVGTVHDITERKLDEEALRHLNRELRAISNCNQTLMRAEDEQSLLSDICRIICDDAGYRMAWVGYAQNDEAKTIRPVAWAGVENGYLEQAQLTWADVERGRGPSGSAIRSGESICIQDFITDPQAAPWRGTALQRGYRSSIALPLKDESAKTFGILNIYAAMPNAYTPGEIRLLEELAEDMAFGIMVLRTRIERQQAEAALQERERHSQSLLRLSRNMEYAQTYAAVLNAAREEVINIIGYQNLWAYLLTDDKKYAKALVAGGPDSDMVMSEAGSATLTIAGDPMLEEIAEAKEIIIVEDAQTDKRVNQEIVARLGNRTIVNVPIILFDRHLGSVGMGTFGAEGVRVPSGPERKYLVALASHMAAALDRIHLLAGREQAEEEIKALNLNLERRVEERTAQLEAANRELEAFSYSVSHDLRAPLRAIDGFSHILLDDYSDKLDDEGRRLLNVVRDNTSRMGQLIDDILKFSRAGRLDMTLAEIDMGKLAREVFEELRPAVAADKLQVEIGPIPPVPGDRAMMRQVFVNLLANAIKFSRARVAARIKVGGSLQGNEAVYYVQDNGVGFDMRYADKLFGVFQRLHSVSEFEGTGIGLAIVKRIVTRHGGRVWAEGKAGEGATFYFALPLKEG